MSNEEETPQTQEPEPSEEVVTTEEPSNEEAAEDNADANDPGESEEMNRPPFDLKAGVRISYGQKQGSIISVRGNGKAPYEVGIRWTDEKHPQWMLFASLEMAYEQGTLAVNP